VVNRRREVSGDASLRHCRRDRSWIALKQKRLSDGQGLVGTMKIVVWSALK